MRNWELEQSIYAGGHKWEQSSLEEFEMSEMVIE
jgi:hypothetical protein